MKKEMLLIIITCILIAGTSYCKDQPQGASVKSQPKSGDAVDQPKDSVVKALSEGDAIAPHGQILGAKYVGMDTCAMCHEKVVKNFKRSEHARIVVAGKQEGQACEACHGPGSLHADTEGKANKKATIINPGKDPEACYKCHMEKRASFSLQYHHPVPEGKISCTDCHDPHGDDAVMPNTIGSLSAKNVICAKCHKDQTRPYVYEHEALREGCTVCHAVHGSINDKMLIERDLNLCMKCHTQANFPATGNIGHDNHSTNARRGPCWSGGCHTAVHGSNFDDHLRI